MDNQTSIQFHILPFSLEAKYKLLIFGIFLNVYLIGIFLNLAVIAVICLNVHLHSPMYVFFCNLSFIDICYTTVTIPKLLHILLSGDDLLSVTQCFTQTYFYIICASAEETLLFVMGFDRYVAICRPLFYHRILNKKICILIMVSIWITSFINSFIVIIPLQKLPFRRVSSIQDFFCDAIDIFNASNGGSQDYYSLIYGEIVVFALVPFICNLVSYGNIIRVILQIKSKEGRIKTFSTCSSHLIVMIIYYSAGSLSYLIPFSEKTVLSPHLSVMYIIVVPMINPLIYSLRNKELLRSCQKLLK
ncbi:hypothetical protein GDO81_023894, partial [Engystomops pustulosus]